MISGGEPLPATLREAFKQRFGVPLFEGYGLTETSRRSCRSTCRRTARPGSVGRPVPGARCKIADDDGKALPTGEQSARSGSRAR